MQAGTGTSGRHRRQLGPCINEEFRLFTGNFMLYDDCMRYAEGMNLEKADASMAVIYRIWQMLKRDAQAQAGEIAGCYGLFDYAREMLESWQSFPGHFVWQASLRGKPGLPKVPPSPPPCPRRPGQGRENRSHWRPWPVLRKRPPALRA